MTYNPEQFVATHQENLQALQGLTTQAYSGFEKLIELNMAASKAALGESFHHVQTVLQVKDQQQWMALESSFLQSLAEKSVTYNQHVYALVAGIGAEFTKALEGQLAQTKTVVADAIENMLKNAPAGTESAVAAFKSAINASQNVIESAQNSAKKAAEVVESNFTAVTSQTVHAAKKH